MSGLPGLRPTIYCLGLVFYGLLFSEEALPKSDSLAIADKGAIDSNKVDGKPYGKGKTKQVRKDTDEPYYEQPTYRTTASIMRSLRPNSPILNREYLDHFSGKAHPKGTITTKVFIDPDGQVIRARIIGDAIKDSAFATKALTFFNGLKFEPIKPKLIDSVSIPFSFSP